MLSEGDRAWLQAFFTDIGGRLNRVEARMEAIENRQTSIEKCVDGVFDYVRLAVEGDHRDAEHAERVAADALEKLRGLELDRAHDLENHERKARGTGGE
jgi:hypothetical protein